MARKTIELAPIKETTQDFEAIEKELERVWRQEIYLPILKILGTPQKVLNDYDALKEALRSGKITYNRGQFSGRFNASTSRELKRLGARWDRKTGTFRLPQSSMPQEIRMAVAASETAFLKKIDAIDKKLSQILPGEVAAKMKTKDMFDTTLWRTQKDFEETVKGITIAPKLTKEQSERIASEWQNNMDLWVKDWTEKNIKKLRSQMKSTVLAGNRYEAAVSTIQKSYGVSQNKAKFLARQETALMLAKFKETRYESAGVKSYIWGCVAGSKNHPVRPWHKALEGKEFRWDNPPITTEPGQPIRKNNPGQDYNCRCFARPVVRVKKD